MPRWSNFLLGFLLAILGWLTPTHAISPAFVPEEVTQIVAPTSQATAAIRDQLTAYRPNGPPAQVKQQSLNPGVHRGIWVVVFDGDVPSAVVLQYAYAGGDPVNRWDPSGLWDIDVNSWTATAEDGDSISSLWSKLGGSSGTRWGLNEFQSQFLSYNSAVAGDPNNRIMKGTKYRIPPKKMKPAFNINTAPVNFAKMPILKRATTSVRVIDAISILNNAKSGTPKIVGGSGAAWFVSQGDPYTGRQSPIKIDAFVNVQGAIKITTAQLDAMYQECYNVPSLRQKIEGQVRSKLNLSSDAPLSNKAKQSIAYNMNRAAQSHTWQRLPGLVDASPNKVAEVELKGSVLSEGADGEFIITTDPKRITSLQLDTIEAQLINAGEPINNPMLEESFRSALGRKIGTPEVARIQKIMRVGGRVILAAGVAADAVKWYSADFDVRTGVTIAGGWTGAVAAGGAASVYFSPADVAGPWAWAGHGGLVVLSSAGGYWLGSEVTETIYDVSIDE